MAEPRIVPSTASHARQAPAEADHPCRARPRRRSSRWRGGTTAGASRPTTRRLTGTSPRSSASVGGRIVRVHVTDNQAVKAGDRPGRNRPARLPGRRRPRGRGARQRAGVSRGRTDRRADRQHGGHVRGDHRARGRGAGTGRHRDLRARDRVGARAARVGGGDVAPARGRSHAHRPRRRTPEGADRERGDPAAAVRRGGGRGRGVAGGGRGGTRHGG